VRVRWQKVKRRQFDSGEQAQPDAHEEQTGNNRNREGEFGLILGGQDLISETPTTIAITGEKVVRLFPGFVCNCLSNPSLNLSAPHEKDRHRRS